MRRSDFHYELPPELIAQHPAATRSASRMLCLDPLRDAQVTDLPAQLHPGDLLVFNDTRVIPARLYGEKDTGGKIEILVERLLGEHEALAQVRASKAPQPGSRLHIEGVRVRFTVEGREGEFYRLRLEDGGAMLPLLEAAGHMPLPPYIERPDASEDRERYQTLFAREPGAVAAPTAGLHFDEALLAAIRARGVDIGLVTLHIGAGTFQPVRVEDLAQHRMHRERVRVSAALCEQIQQARERGGRVVAIGTTVVRSLEIAAVGGGQGPGRATLRGSAGSEAGPLSAGEQGADLAPRGPPQSRSASALPAGVIRPFDGETDIFITPGFRFQVVDALLTNFHLPESTLLMLVSAFAGRERVFEAYAHAVRHRYRFFSYGDAMWIPRRIAP